jgi:hypothetical protein
MHQEQPLQKTKAPYRRVGGICSLHAFLSADAHAYVGRLDHRHIIRAVAHSQCADTTTATQALSASPKLCVLQLWPGLVQRHIVSDTRTTRTDAFQTRVGLALAVLYEWDG